MSDPFIGEIRLFGGDFAPIYWALCDGRAIPNSQNEPLFTLIGNTYGGDDQHFKLPDLRGRFPIHQGQLTGGGRYQTGMTGGQEMVTLSTEELPRHDHPVRANTEAGNQRVPVNAYWSASALNNFAEAVPMAQMANCIGESGEGHPHENMIPFQVVNFIISLAGIFPSRA